MIVAIGDSITAGQYLPADEKPWPLLIQGHTIVAAGVSSDTTRLGLERFPNDVQNRWPESVVIQFGHNDCNRWETDRGLPRVSIKAFAANLEEMVARCRVFGAKPYLCSITPTKRSAHHIADVFAYNGVLLNTAAMLTVEVIDVRGAFLEHESLLLEDGLHLSQKGHRIYAATVQAALDA